MGDDSLLIRAAQAGSADAVEGLIRRHWHPSHRTAFLIVQDVAAAEDVCQEAMLAAIRTIDRVDSRRAFAPWLHRIVVNRALDWVRASKRRAEVEHAGQSLAEAAPEAPATDSVPGDLLAALAALEPDERAIVVLRHLFDYDSSEIGAMLDLPAPTVRTQLRRALERLRALLGDQEEAG